VGSKIILTTNNRKSLSFGEGFRVRPNDKIK
jgi:hypothetical protein